MTRTLAAAALAAAFGLAACGGQSDEEQVRDVATQLATADPDVCDHATNTFLRQAGRDRDTCRKALQSNKSPHAKVASVSVDGDQATARLSQGRYRAKISFVKDGGDWKVNGAR